MYSKIALVYLKMAIASFPLATIFKYYFCMVTNKPYFGRFLLSRQMNPARQDYMQKTIRNLIETRGEVNVLEIGSWAGQSAVLWGNELLGSLGRLICVDPWSPVYENQWFSNSATEKMNKISKNDKIFPLFWHNIKACGLENIVIPIRGKSIDVLPYFSDESFDLIYVDGSHAYSDFAKDLELSARLVKPGGLLCGDDLELQSGDIDVEFANIVKEKDFVIDPKTGAGYHPGICLGVRDFFKRRISCYNGFWVVRKINKEWVDEIM